MGVTVGLLLAAGAGTRLGRPKALVVDGARRTWLERAATAMIEGGVEAPRVVVGAEAVAVRRVVPPRCVVVEAVDWQEGMGASMRAGLVAIARDSPTADAVLIMLVDTPGIGSDVVRRLLGLAAPDVLARAGYDGMPGHPVLIGREHWQGVLDVAGADRGARDYLGAHSVTLVECSDIGSGLDIDTPDALARWEPDHPG